MKRFVIVPLSILLCLILAACSSSGANDSSAPDADIRVETPYTDIVVPEIYKDAVENEVVSEDPYTLLFKTKDDGTELYSVVFGDSGDFLLGTLDDGTSVYINVYDLDSSSGDYDSNAMYQEGLYGVLENLCQNSSFKINNALNTDEMLTFGIKTDVVTLKYPRKWKNKVKVDVDGDTVRFSCSETELFDFCFFEVENGTLIGTYKNNPIYIVNYEVENDEYLQMVEDLNVIIKNLMKDENFVVYVQ